jgi:methionyl-tRNA formyltransferase
MDERKLRLVFMGTPAFALPMLESAVREEHVAAVVTQPDRPSGRKRQVSQPPVKVLAAQKDIEVLQPLNVSHPNAISKISDLRPDLIVVVAYGAILKAPLLELPTLGCINIHPSLLPRHRGPCPIEWTLIKGEKVSGISCIYMDEGMDTGDIIMQRELDISASDTTGSLREKLSRLGAEVLAETLNQIKKGKVSRFPQKGNPTYAPMLDKKDCLIDWSKSALSIHNLVRALNPHPGVRAFPNGQSRGLIIWETELSGAGNEGSAPGEVTETSRDGITVSTGEGCLLLRSIQPEGGKKQTGAEYIRGHNIEKFTLSKRLACPSR